MCLDFCFWLVSWYSYRLVGIPIPIGIASSVVRLKTFAITAVVKTWKSILKKNHDKIALLAITKLKAVEV